MEWLGRKQPGLYGCIFDDITSNETSLIQLIETSFSTSSTKNQNYLFTSNEDHSTRFIIDDTIFSKCTSSLDIETSEQNGVLIDAITKNAEIKILNSEFRSIEMHSRNMIYIGWNEDETQKEFKIMIIANTLITNCLSTIPGMKVISYPQFVPSSLQSQSQNIEQNSDIVSNELYSDGNTIYDIVDKHGLICVEKLNRGTDIEISSGLIDISNMFVAGCHSAVGSLISVTGLTFKLSQSIFIQPI
ncbi:MAG: hypothetical protein EZS28_014003 [Streblomastix strix]|uniref:Uncharacterized protein n=1 Tax=Streblomastix strix TaxID=222440 RepID=A0A5J4W708_9EUKA|nr:MAG: hypothetical protein EZS28_014003 [Streblomastix strix]